MNHTSEKILTITDYCKPDMNSKFLNIIHLNETINLDKFGKVANNRYTRNGTAVILFLYSIIQ